MTYMKRLLLFLMIMLIPLIGNTNPTPWGRSGGSGGGRVKLKGDTMTGALYVVTAGDTVWINPAHLEMFRISYNNVLKFSFDSTGIFKANQIKSLADNDTLRLQYRTFTDTSGVKVGMKYNPTINQSSTAGYTAFLIDVTHTATGSGSKKPFKININGVEKYSIDSDGYILTSNHTLIPAAGQMRFGDLNTYVTSDVANQILWTCNNTSVIRYTATGVTPSVPINIGNFQVAPDAGEVTAMDMSVSSGAVDNTPEGYAFSIDGTKIFTVKALSDGGGGIDNKEIILGGYFARTCSTAIVASDTKNQLEMPLHADINVIGTCANDSDAVTMPPASAGREVIVYNAGANILLLFPWTSDNFVTFVADSATTLATQTYQRFVAIDGTTWLVVQ